MRLRDLVAALRAAHGKPPPPPSGGPWEQILRENVVYLADDEAREAAFRDLERRVGTSPRALLAAKPARLEAVARGRGILPGLAPTKLKRAAEVALEHGDPAALVRRPVPEALRALRRFPGIGEPGAERILLFARRHPVLALESNGLRVLQRVGFAAPATSYAASYRSMRRAVEPECPRSFPWLIEAHLLLRRHGREVCRRTRPRCTACPVAPSCAFARDAAGP